MFPTIARRTVRQGRGRLSADRPPKPKHQGRRAVNGFFDNFCAYFPAVKVSGKQNRLLSGFFNQLFHFLGIFFLTRKIVQRHIGPFPGKGDCRRPSDAGIAARNQRLAAGQPVAPLITVFAAVGLLFHFGLHTGRFLELFFKLAVKIRFLRINQFRFFIHGFFPLL